MDQSTDSKFITTNNRTSCLSLRDLKIPRKTCEINFDASPMATDGKFILIQNTKYSLGLYECDTLSLYRQINCTSTDLSNIIDLHWTTSLPSFLLLTRKYLYTLTDDYIHKTPVLRNNTDFYSMTSDDENHKLYLATHTSIEEYSFSAFIFLKEYEIDDYHLYSIRFNTCTKQFGLALRSHNHHQWYFQIRNHSMISLWLIRTPIEYGSCSVSILFSCNEWIVINTLGDILFQITSDGKIQAEVIYGGRMLLNAIEINEKILMFRTFGYLEKHHL